jgi:hypothetical protein
MYKKPSLPSELEPIRKAALRALGPVQPADDKTQADKNFLFDAKRSEAGRSLPPYYLVYFLLVDLLGFKNLGQFEKVSWSVPVDFQGRAYLIEHRKFGLGVFVQDLDRDEDDARKIVLHIKKAVKAARPFFEWLAEQAAEASALNVTNNSDALFKRFGYFLDAYKKKAQEAQDRKDEKIVEEGKTSGGGTWTSISYPAFALRAEAHWLALAAIEAFFSWTEHVFIHIGILKGELTTGKDVARLAEADWSAKFKCGFDLSDPTSKGFFDQLVEIRRGLRNFVAHGAFGKDGQAFKFHSGAGAVPLLLPHRRNSQRFIFGGGLAFDHDSAVKAIEAFIEHLWADDREPAKLYLESQLPVILSMATDGRYSAAMASVEDMKQLVDHLSHEFDRAANMDW